MDRLRWVAMTETQTFETDWANVGLNGVEWYDRVVGIQPNSPYLPTHWQMNVTSNTSTQNTSNPALTGGVPGNPALEQGYQTRAIQAIFTLNESQAPDLQGMLAGLLLNKSGNFTGWLYGATNELPTLGLLPAISNALANSTYRNDGAYGAPTYSGAQSNPPGWWLFGASSWDLVSGVITGLKLIVMIWTQAIAALAYFGELALKVVQWGLHKLSQVPVFRAACATIRGAVNALFSALESAVTNLVNSAVQRFVLLEKSSVTSLDNSISLYSNPNTTGQAFVEAARGAAPLWAAATIIAIAITIISYVLEPEEDLFGPVAIFLAPVILTAFSVGSVRGHANQFALGTSSVTAFFDSAASGAQQFVPSNCQQTATDVSLVAAIASGLAFIGAAIELLLPIATAAKAGELARGVPLAGALVTGGLLLLTFGLFIAAYAEGATLSASNFSADMSWAIVAIAGSFALDAIAFNVADPGSGTLAFLAMIVDAGSGLFVYQQLLSKGC